ncbi:MAG: radical SAM protein [Lachnospiraceae bacterium]|nr:radical SAM protein [Lachnospiraceae bacterium]
MIEQKFITSFKDKDYGIVIKDIIAFSNGHTAVLYEKTGHILRVDACILEDIQNQDIPLEIINKLKSRNFIYNSDNFGNISNCSQNYLPEFFMIDLTNKCNMHCKYCLRDICNSKNSISENKIKDICNYIMQYCKENHIKDITIQPWGGEPLMELKSIILMRKLLSMDETKVHFSIETNAVLLDLDVIEILYKYKIGLGISIDGYRELHDAQRLFQNGKASHSIVEKNLLLAKQKYGFRLGTITTITKINAPYIENILEYYAVNLELTNVKFNYVHESMFCDCSDLCLSKEEIAKAEIKLLNKLVELNERGYNISEQNIKVKLKNLLLKQYSDICHSYGCLGGRKMIVFDMQGNMFPCELTDIPHEKIGSIYDGMGLSDIVKDAIKNRDFFVAKKVPECQNCFWYIFCKGGCTVRAISIGKRPPEIDSIECAVNSVLYPELLKLMVEKPNIVNKLINKKVL